MRKVIIKLLCVVALAAMILWGAVLVADWQRQSIVATLVETIQSGSDAEAVAAISQLPRLNEAGIDVLVATAGQPRARVAPAARWAVEDLLTSWYEQAETDTRQFGTRLGRLTTAMASHVTSYSTDGRRWIRQLATDVLTDLDRLPPSEGVTIVANCEAVLRATVDLEPVLAETEEETDAADADSVTEVTKTTGDVANVAGAPAMSVAEPLAALPTQSLPVARAGASPPPVTFPPAIASPPSVAPQRWRGQTGTNDSRAADWNSNEGASPSGGAEPNPLRSRGENEPQRTPLQFSAPNLSSTTTHKSNADETEPDALAATYGLPLEEKVAMIRQLAALNGPELIARLVNSPTVERPHVEEEMRRRNLDPIPMPLALMLAAEKPEERIKGVDALLRMPSVRPGPWLALMADDPSADVRLVVVSLLSTSEDPQLLEKAWQVALHDTDHRIGQLARTLQARRESLQRR